MCTGGNDLERNGHVYISTLEGERLKLQAVSCYVYLGLLIQCNLRCVQLLKTLRKISNQRTWTLIQLAAKTQPPDPTNADHVEILSLQRHQAPTNLLLCRR